VVWYGRGDISSTFASTYKIATPLPTPFTIHYLFEGNAHVYLPDAIGQLQDGSLLMAEAGMEQEKRRARNQAKAEAARQVALAQSGVYWIGTEATLLPQRHANVVFLHARRQPFPSFPELAEALQVVWPWGEAACVQEVVERLGERWSPAEKEAAVWKRCADAAACGHLLVDLAHVQLTRLTPLICLSPSSPPILPDPLPSVLESNDIQDESRAHEAGFAEQQDEKPTNPLSTFDDSLLDEEQREHFLRNLRAVEAVLNGATLREAAEAAGMGRSTLGRLVQRTVEFGQVACVPHAAYHRAQELHVAACKANWLGLQTRAFMGQRSVRTGEPTDQHSMRTGQHSCANGLQTRLWANTHCEWGKGWKINPWQADPSSQPTVSKLNDRILLANSKVPKYVRPTYLLGRQKSRENFSEERYF
jgi:hypothetical protein